MQKSHRISNINEAGSDGWEVFLKARKMISEGVKVTELSIGEHDIRTDKSILDAMHASALAGKTGYAMVPGMHSLRKAVAKRVQARTGGVRELRTLRFGWVTCRPPAQGLRLRAQTRKNFALPKQRAVA